MHFSLEFVLVQLDTLHYISMVQVLQNVVFVSIGYSLLLVIVSGYFYGERMQLILVIYREALVNA